MNELAKQNKLLELEIIIENDMKAFLRVGSALLTIRKERLYPDATWRDYLERRWPQYQTSYTYSLMNAAHIHGYLENSAMAEFLPFNERQIRPLERLGTFKQHELGNVNPDIWVEAWIYACKLANPSYPTEKHVKQAVDVILKERIGSNIPPAQEWNGQWDLNQFYIANITARKFYNSIPVGSIDFIITDPPYAPDDDNTYPLYEGLGKLALKALKPGGFCCVYFGKLDLPLMFNIMQEYLDYDWCYAVYQPRSRWNFRKTQFKGCWRPIGIFRKPGKRFHTVYFPDAMESKREKDYHDWQQGINPALDLIKKYTNENHLILEPFCGGGTIPIAARQLNRNFIAFDIDKAALASAQERMREYEQARIQAS